MKVINESSDGVIFTSRVSRTRDQRREENNHCNAHVFKLGYSIFRRAEEEAWN